MNRRSRLTLSLLFFALFCQAAGPNVAVQEAVAALQKQDYSGAEQKLRAELKIHPNDAETLSLLGVALDGQNKFDEAAPVHQRALAIAPRSSGVLNNYANNRLSSGDEKGAREAFLKAVAADPTDDYANRQLAQLAINRRDGPEALTYLDRLPKGPETNGLRLAALGLAGSRSEADNLFTQLTAATQNDARLSSDYGWLLAKAGLFDQAEVFLSNALAADPSNYQILYSLGVTASQAGHNERAREVLESALRQRPQSVNAMYALAFVYSALKQPEPTIRLLAEAGRLDPQRADIQKLMAVTTSDIRAHEDSVAAWERYMKLVPEDDAARRERGFEKAPLGLFVESLADLEWYVARHPDDAMGYYELGAVEMVNDPAKGLAQLNRAIQLKPDFAAARMARGAQEYLQGDAEAALPDLEFVARQPAASPSGLASVLDRLGQTYVSLDRVSDALPVLRKAAELAPDDSAIQLHLANALAEAGQTKESDALMAKYRQMRPTGGPAPAVRGVVDYLSLSPEQQHDSYQARLEKTVREHPEDPKGQLLYLKFLLSDQRVTDAVADARRFAALKPGPLALADAGHALLGAGAYAPAKEILEQIEASARPAGLRLDLAVATFHTAGAGAATAADALTELDQIPQTARGDDFYLARAQMLDAAGKQDDAMAAMDQALKVAPERPELYWQAAALMMRNHRTDAALQLLDRATAALPKDPQIPVIKAAMLELAGKTDDARHLLMDTQRRWPERPAVWVAQGMILAAHGQFDEARRSLETAVAVGAHSPETWIALATSTWKSGADHTEAAGAAISQALKLSPDDPEALKLAAQIRAKQAQKKDAGSAGAGNDAIDPAKLFLTKPPADW